MQSAMRGAVLLALPGLVVAGVPEPPAPPPLRVEFWYLEDPWWVDLLDALAVLVAAGLAVALLVAVARQFRFTP
jgi:hypothetical protein